ncbi:MAG: hypothetical protein ACLFTH_00910 [Candidatus Woesearchaeota archaeon]
MAAPKKKTLESHVDSISEKNLTYRPKPTLVNLSEKYDLPEHGSTDCDFDRVKEMLFESHAFSKDEIAKFKQNNDIRYFLADLDTGQFSLERTEEIINRYKHDSNFREEIKDLLHKTSDQFSK